MTLEEEQLRQENRRLQEQVRSQQELLERQSQQIALLTTQAEDLQARLSKDSHNSHLPPSSDRFKRQPKSLRKKSGKKAGGQPGHPGQHLQMAEEPDRVISHRIESCPACQQDLREVAALVQYGPALGALAVYLVQQQLLPYERVSELFFDLFGHPISVATIVSLGQRCAEQLTEVEQQIKTALVQAEVLHQDETGLSVAGKRHWVHVSAPSTLTQYTVHPNRGKQAFDAIGILPGFQGVSEHDGWRCYWAYDCQHATCNVHLLRDLTFLAEEQHQDWAAQMKDLLLSMKEAVEQARAEGRSGCIRSKWPTGKRSIRPSCCRQKLLIHVN
jgi:transposase